NHDMPPFSLGEQDMYSISPDALEVAYTSNSDEFEATSTNNVVFTVPINVGQVSNLPSGNSQVENLRHTTPKKISTSPGADTTPLYSPDGKFIAWRSQARAGFEADKWRLLVQDRQSGKTRDLTEKIDRSVGSFAWDDHNVLYFSFENRGESIFAATSPEGENFALPEPYNDKHLRQLHADDLIISGHTLFFSQMLATAPSEIWRFD